ncbi:hypothetical protein BDZ91DRAFT_799817 [Kalaharituber pfeilii]|nr:hypothetical protein BDZ91DRAFT_799817 [Kalaharituber pfeilii]
MELSMTNDYSANESLGEPDVTADINKQNPLVLCAKNLRQAAAWTGTSSPHDTSDATITQRLRATTTASAAPTPAVNARHVHFAPLPSSSSAESADRVTSAALLQHDVHPYCLADGPLTVVFKVTVFAKQAPIFFRRALSVDPRRNDACSTFLEVLLHASQQPETGGQTHNIREHVSNRIEWEVRVVIWGEEGVKRWIEDSAGAAAAPDTEQYRQQAQRTVRIKSCDPVGWARTGPMENRSQVTPSGSARLPRPYSKAHIPNSPYGPHPPQSTLVNSRHCPGSHASPHPHTPVKLTSSPPQTPSTDTRKKSVSWAPLPPPLVHPLVPISSKPYHIPALHGPYPSDQLTIVFKVDLSAVQRPSGFFQKVLYVNQYKNQHHWSLLHILDHTFKSAEELWTRSREGGEAKKGKRKSTPWSYVRNKVLWQLHVRAWGDEGVRRWMETGEKVPGIEGGDISDDIGRVNSVKGKRKRGSRGKGRSKAKINSKDRSLLVEARDMATWGKWMEGLWEASKSLGKDGMVVGVELFSQNITIFFKVVFPAALHSPVFFQKVFFRNLAFTPNSSSIAECLMRAFPVRQDELVQPGTLQEFVRRQRVWKIYMMAWGNENVGEWLHESVNPRAGRWARRKPSSEMPSHCPDVWAIWLTGMWTVTTSMGKEGYVVGVDIV